MIPTLVLSVVLLVFIVITAAILIYIENRRRRKRSTADSESPNLTLDMHPDISRHLNLSNYSVQRVDRHGPDSIFIVLRESPLRKPRKKPLEDDQPPPTYDQICGSSASTNLSVSEPGTSTSPVVLTPHSDTIRNNFEYKVN